MAQGKKIREEAGWEACPYDQLFIYELVRSPGPLAPDLEKGFWGCWVEGEAAFLFFDRPAEAQARCLSKGAAIRDQYQMSYQDWQGGQALEAFSVGGLTIRPPWIAPAGQGLEVLLDPGVVFGSGNHPTTTHCLEALVELAAGPGMPEEALDLGCGSGLLALAAARLGAKRVVAVDLNPLCVQVATRNADLNHLGNRVTVFEADALDLAEEQAGLVMANLEAELIEAFSRRGGFVGRDWLILSGLTRSKAGRTADLVQAAGFRLVSRWAAQGTWQTFFFGPKDFGKDQSFRL